MHQVNIFLIILLLIEFLFNFNFFLAISKGIWYYDRGLGEKRIRGMFREICLVCGINISGRNISNHSGRDTAINI